MNNISPFVEGEASRPAFILSLSAQLPTSVTLNVASLSPSVATVETATVTFPAGGTGPISVNMHPLDNQTRGQDAVCAVHITYNSGDACLSGHSQTVNTTIRDNERYTFVTDATSAGNAAMGSGMVEMTWDSFCNSNRGARPDVTWRALIGTQNRISPAPPGTGVDWPLRREHNYLLARVNGTVGGTAFVTDNNALPSPTFALLDSGQTATDVWLGFTNTWANSFDNCVNWQVAGSSATVGNPAGMDQGTFFGAGPVNCAGPASIWCVEE